MGETPFQLQKVIIHLLTFNTTERRTLVTPLNSLQSYIDPSGHNENNRTGSAGVIRNSYLQFFFWVTSQLNLGEVSPITDPINLSGIPPAWDIASDFA